EASEYFGLSIGPHPAGIRPGRIPGPGARIPYPNPTRLTEVARILIACWGSFGDVYPYVGLAFALKDRGHHPAFATAEFYRPLIESLGFEFHPMGPTIDPGDQAMIERVLDPVRGADALVKDLLLPSLDADYAALDLAAQRAEVMVTHPITFAAPVVAQARGLPWVSTVLAP